MLMTNRLATSLDPWRIMQAIENQWSQRVGDLFEGSALASDGGVRMWTGDGEAVVEFDLPGHAVDRFDVSVHRNLLTVDVRPAEGPGDDGEFHVRERLPTTKRQVQLPFDVDPQQTVAEYQRGVLRMTVRQPESHRPARIAVKGL